MGCLLVCWSQTYSSSLALHCRLTRLLYADIPEAALFTWLLKRAQLIVFMNCLHGELIDFKEIPLGI